MKGKHLQIALILLITLAVLKFIRGGLDFDIRSVIPFMGGADISIYDWAGLALLVIFAGGLARLHRRGRPRDDTADVAEEDVYEVVEEPEADESDEDES